jgi:hypothetical protein
MSRSGGDHSRIGITISPETGDAEIVKEVLRQLRDSGVDVQAK